MRMRNITRTAILFIYNELRKMKVLGEPLRSPIEMNPVLCAAPEKVWVDSESNHS